MVSYNFSIPAKHPPLIDSSSSRQKIKIKALRSGLIITDAPQMWNQSAFLILLLVVGESRCPVQIDAFLRKRYGTRHSRRSVIVEPNSPEPD